MFNLVILDGFAINPGDLSWDKFKNICNVTIYKRTDQKDVNERIKNAEIILTNKTVLDAETITSAEKLKYIGVLATGFNVVDIKAAKQRNIPVTNIPAYGTDSVAQMVFAHLLELCQHVQRHSDKVKQGRWSENKDFCFWDYPLIELKGKTLGIIGFGRIGKRTADIANAFGMNVKAYSRTKSSYPLKNFEWVGLQDLFTVSDVISLHCPLTSDTRHIINKDTLSLMKKSSFLINTSRGGLIKDEDLAYALNNNLIAGAGLDVLSDKEPPKKDNPLFNAKNVLISPHIAWASYDARIRLLDTAYDNVKNFLNGNIQNCVNLEV